VIRKVARRHRDESELELEDKESSRRWKTKRVEWELGGKERCGDHTGARGQGACDTPKKKSVCIVKTGIIANFLGILQSSAFSNRSKIIYLKK
jgi:hypothetical protein